MIQAAGDHRQVVGTDYIDGEGRDRVKTQRNAHRVAEDVARVRPRQRVGRSIAVVERVGEATVSAEHYSRKSLSVALCCRSADPALTETPVTALTAPKIDGDVVIKMLPVAIGVPAMGRWRAHTRLDHADDIRRRGQAGGGASEERLAKLLP